MPSVEVNMQLKIVMLYILQDV